MKLKFHTCFLKNLVLYEALNCLQKLWLFLWLWQHAMVPSSLEQVQEYLSTWLEMFWFTVTTCLEKGCLETELVMSESAS